MIWIRKTPLVLIGIIVIAMAFGGCQQKSSYKNTTVSFPASTFQEFDVEPFDLHLNIPPTWEIRIPNDNGVVPSDLLSPVGLYDGDTLVGSIGYNTYQLYPDAESGYHAIYSQLMQGATVNWDNEYKPVAQSHQTNSASCLVLRKDMASEKSVTQASDTYNRGILAHNDQLLVYIGIELFDEDCITIEQFDMLASSLSIE